MQQHLPVNEPSAFQMKGKAKLCFTVVPSTETEHLGIMLRKLLLQQTLNAIGLQRATSTLCER